MKLEFLIIFLEFFFCIIEEFDIFVLGIEYEHGRYVLNDLCDILLACPAVELHQLLVPEIWGLVFQHLCQTLEIVLLQCRPKHS